MIGCSSGAGVEDPPATGGPVLDPDNAAAAPQISAQQFEAATLWPEPELDPLEGCGRAMQRLEQSLAPDKRALADTDGG